MHLCIYIIFLTKNIHFKQYFAATYAFIRASAYGVVLFFVPATQVVLFLPQLCKSCFAFSKRNLCNGENCRIKDFDEF